MNKIILCLMIEDPGYSAALTKSLLTTSNCFSIEGNPSMYFDVLLTDDLNSQDERAVFLTDDPLNERLDEERNIFIVYKYQHLARISTTLRLAYSVFKNVDMLTEEINNTSIVSICSSEGGVGCTSIALGISQELTRFRGKRVLYLNMEEFESTALFFPDANGGANNISRFVYTMLNNQNGDNRSPMGYLINDGYGTSTFRPSQGRNPLRELNSNEFIKFVKHILKDNAFTDLIIDCGSGLDESIVSALCLSGKIFHVIGKSPNTSRIDAYLRTVTNRTGESQNAEWSYVQNFYEKSKKMELNSQFNYEKVSFRIEHEKSGFEMMSGCTIMSMDKAFGQGMRQIVEHICITHE